MTWTVRLIGLLALAVSFPFSGAEELDVWDPSIHYPHQKTVWHVGERHRVQWSTAGAPEHFNNNGIIYLVQSDHIDRNHPLAEGFKLTAGQVEIQVPDVKPGYYQLDLFGDSGNWSELFYIGKA